jgi:hypothetical protein
MDRARHFELLDVAWPAAVGRRHVPAVSGLWSFPARVSGKTIFGSQ